MAYTQLLLLLLMVMTVIYLPTYNASLFFFLIGPYLLKLYLVPKLQGHPLPVVYGS
jgi:hypothetical protein